MKCWSSSPFDVWAYCLWWAWWEWGMRSAKVIIMRHINVSACAHIYIYAYRTLGRSQNKKWKFLPFSVGPPHFHFLLKFEYTKIHQKELKNSVLGPKTTCIFGKKKLKDTRDPRLLMANALIFFFHFLDSFPFFADTTLVLYTLMILVTLVISLRPGQPLCLILRKKTEYFAIVTSFKGKFEEHTFS